MDLERPIYGPEAPANIRHPRLARLGKTAFYGAMSYGLIKIGLYTHGMDGYLPLELVTATGSGIAAERYLRANEAQ